MNDLTRRDDAGLPADFLQKLSSGIAESRATTVIAGGGKPLLRLLRGGSWVFGQNNEEVQPGSRWVVNIRSLAHGYICWVEGALRGEVLTSMTAPKPAMPVAIEGVPFQELRTFDLKCIDGDDTGTEVLHKINSISGIKAVDGLLAAIFGQLAADPAHPCPVLRLGTDGYQHKQYGWIDTPVYEVVGWSDMNGNLAGEAAPQLAPAEPAPAAPARKRKAPLETAATAPAAPVAPVEPVAPAPTAQLHVGQRRRPGSR